MFVSVNHRLSQNFTLIANYTWSHCIDLGDFGGELSSSRLISNPNNFSNDVGNCSFDVRHIFNSSPGGHEPALRQRLAKTIWATGSFHHRELPLRQPLFGAGRDRLFFDRHQAGPC